MIWLIILCLATCLFLMKETIARNLNIFLWSLQQPGPAGLPPLGAGHRFMCHKDEIFNRIRRIFSEFQQSLFVLWLGPKLIVVIRDPQYIQTVMQSDMTEKDNIIKHVGKPFIGEGLITGSGPKWKSHKKIIQSSLGIKPVAGYYGVFNHQSRLMVERMQKTLSDRTSLEIDLEEWLHPCSMDIVCDTIMGVPMNTQALLNKDFMNAYAMMYFVMYERMAKPWLYPDLLFRFSSLSKVQRDSVKILRDFIWDVIQKKRDEKQSKIVEALIKAKLNDDPAEESNDKITQKLMLDQLIESSNAGALSITDDEMIDEMLTMFAASSDTIASIACFCLKMLAQHPEYQKRVVEEYTNALSESDKPLDAGDCAELTFLEMCIKETIRLFPIAPLIVRRNDTNFKISESITVPPGVTVMMGLFFTHRDPRHWSNPEEFHPDHFRPEEVAKRHSYAYVPFGGGGRSCIGKLYAVVSIKVIVVNVLRSFILECDKNEPAVKDVPLCSDISIRAIHGNKVIIRRRQ